MELESIQKPSRIGWVTETLTDTYGEFHAEPFERGFGHTVGNSMRRVLLSSLSGAAITQIKIDGVLHEFTTIPNITEDVTDIALNLKEVRLKFTGTPPKVCNIDFQGPKDLKAGDLQVDDEFTILNPDHHIAAIGRNGKFKMAFRIDIGRGYVPVELKKREIAEEGIIYLDAMYSPIRKVAYRVEETRLGRRTDYDKLILQVWTDGSILPQDAMTGSADILREQFSLLVGISDLPDEQSSDTSKAQDALIKILVKPIEELELSVRALNCLKNTEIESIYDLVQQNDADMLKTRNFGRKSLVEIKEVLKSMELELGMKPEDLPKIAPELFGESKEQE